MNKATAKSAILTSSLTTDQKRWVCHLIDEIDLSPAAPRFAFAAPDMTPEQTLEANSVILAAMPPSATRGL